MLQGLRTVVYPVRDVARAKHLFTTITGTEPYFDQPFYVGYSVGGYELGLDPNGFAEDPAAVATSYWGVADVEEAVRALVAAGATPHTEIRDVGEGIRLASVKDADGNILGVIENPNFTLG